ncbi:DNA polymerase III subunit gamma/tau [Photobacterium aphoticum]|uniref:DNA polymerase III subunit gamma/tau n=2 Tax=Photobacterium aphoticum TaxID=754436 RepID=A0A0J1GKN7_9GAMM|nr:DNA polymerase III subunit gamma/tau [Photobacterium aphoticum]KLV00034.1 DNA polymerase III subunit gamma/tau [Photobacterium aphoticum]PSU58540.1 DNA polymerase III subunit gamma/tau [Photobacterium aphoticum]GHA48283.1 DNA polymerase III subunit gamma/tau [Photobacterium aphoticum]
MSYQVLARKWRPHQFDDVVGQSHVLTALANALAHNRLHHAYLFSGTRGVGKTTIARIFAKGLNCEQGITASPCGQCETCREIDEGRFVDLLEIDAASRTKVEDTRDLLDNVQYKPARGRFKVYLIDEVHMLSRHSFNALLKTLEEPPEYVKFILATTDPQKLPVTILSRCLQFHLKHLDNTQIQTQLEHVLTEEQVSFEPRALSLLARAAEGSMRDALSLTDQAIALGNGQVQADAVSTMLGTLNTEQALYLLEAVAQGTAEPAMACLEELAGIGVEWDSLLRELAAQLHRVAMHQALPASLDESAPDAERIVALSQSVSPQEVQLCYQIALQGRQDLAFAPDGRTGLEMVLLRMLAFRPVSVSAMAPQPIAVPATQPASPAPSTSSLPQSGAPQGIERVQALKAQMQQPQQQAAMPQAQPSSPQQQGQQYAPVQQAYGEQPATGQSTMGQSTPQAHGMPSQGMSAQPSTYPQHDYGQPVQSQAVPSQPAQQAAPQPAAPSAASGLLAARNKLRSQTKRDGNEPSHGKKAEPVQTKKVASSVLDRIASKQNGSSFTPPAMSVPGTSGAPSTSDTPATPEEYQWRPTVAPQAGEAQAVAPTKLKQALEHEKTPEMVKVLVNEAAKQDSWSDWVTQLEVGRMVQQLALNSSFTRNGGAVTLHLRPSQKHLDTPKAREQLEIALADRLNEPVSLDIVLSDEGRSPLEWREALYQEKLELAKQSLQADPNVNFICQRFAAVLDEESVRPL